MFFFEKKNQKTFTNLRQAFSTALPLMDKSLFASFSTEKEESFFFPATKPHLPLQEATHA